jgi:hypothetical protein
MNGRQLHGLWRVSKGKRPAIAVAYTDNNLGNLSFGPNHRPKCLSRSSVSPNFVHDDGGSFMFGLSTEFLIVFAIVAIGVLAVAAMLLTPKPKRAEKWEKAEIMKKLLALSEQEEGRRGAAAVKARPQPARPVTRPAVANLKATSKIATPVRAKAR